MSRAIVDVFATPGQSGAVLETAPGELHVGQDDPPVGGEEFRQRGQPWGRIRLVDRTHPRPTS
ncbi:hypothetical protein [Streptomyces sp. SID161]|uniref:hypothetical protein n=1 Tax=Streptomyces sp. SID161 TaxID=2690251 RepID=UPI0031FEEDA4